MKLLKELIICIKFIPDFIVLKLNELTERLDFEAQADREYEEMRNKAELRKVNRELGK